MLRDRGNIKWIAMMLPEHVAMLRGLKERENDKKKPLIDEQQLEEFNQILDFSLKVRATIEITYYHQHDFKRVRGVISRINGTYYYICIITNEGTNVQIDTENIIEVKKAD